MVVGEMGEEPNLLLHDDCLHAVRHLLCRPNFNGRVRLAYLDPPFNTGEPSREFDDTFDSDVWARFVRERIELIWQALRPDGSLWFHCDDREQTTARVVMDDVVGRHCHVATIVWQRRYSRENRRAFSTSHDYLHVYSPAGSDWKGHRNRLERNDKAGVWRDPDADSRGPWSTVSLVAQGGHGTPDQFYSITLPSGRLVTPPNGSCWRVTRPRFDELVANGEIWFGPDGDNVPRRKVYLRDAKGLVPSTWWPFDEVGHNAEANAELRRLFPDQAPFSTPKPERLMLRVLQIATNPGELVLDPFLGSGTTAAVAHKFRRRWVGIESNGETLERFALPRLQAVVEGRDGGGVSKAVEWTGGGGFVTNVAKKDPERAAAA
jgi:adenine-specific DNA-methyltransferase